MLDIDKIEANDYDYIASQVSALFKSDTDVDNFINFLKNIKNFVSLSNDKRHMTLIDLCYFKSQVQLLEKRIQYVILEMKRNQTKAAVRKIKTVGDKISETSILYNTEDVEGLAGLEELYNVVSSWYTYLQDLYFMCGQTNKNLGSFGSLN